MVRKICRIWWPKNLHPHSDLGLLLFGWFFSSDYGSLDVVVATGISTSKISSSLTENDLEEVLRLVNGEIPLSLLQWSKLSIVGRLDAEFMSNGPDGLGINCTDDKFSTCGCRDLIMIVEPHRQHPGRSGDWIQLISSTDRLSLKENERIIKLHHVHENGKVNSTYDLHVILYDPPTFGRHHFSLNSWNSSISMQSCGTSSQVPNWFCELQRRHSVLDMGTIILFINCSYAVGMLLKRHLKLCTPSSSHKTRSINMIFGHLVSACAASISTLVYIGLQFFHRVLHSRPKPFLCTLIANIFEHAWLNVNIRSSQFLYWPVILQDGGSGFRLNYNVEYMHKVALTKHALWSNIIFDIILGLASGLLLLMHRHAINYGIVALSGQITNNLLRSGCVWLMGVPAGFKLNIELAELFGIVSLNAIQIWSTLWFFMVAALPYTIIALALSGMFLGMTVLVALCIDMLKLATVHISILHFFISFIYSQQILALSSLWRLFRGRKWNPLRKRLDSFDYTVEEHVVGALLFTPILLLLPTTSVFYVFFTMVNSFISITCILVEIMISLLHATPHVEILLWVLRKGRFPSGMWFEILPFYGSQGISSSTNGYMPSNPSLLDKSPNYFWEMSTLVSVLHSNHATIGQIIVPKFRKVFDGMSVSSIFSSFYGLLSGQRISPTMRTAMPPTIPWMSISFWDYWKLCRESIMHVLNGT